MSTDTCPGRLRRRPAAFACLNDGIQARRDRDDELKTHQAQASWPDEAEALAPSQEPRCGRIKRSERRRETHTHPHTHTNKQKAKNTGQMCLPKRKSRESESKTCGRDDRAASWSGSLFWKQETGTGRVEVGLVVESHVLRAALDTNNRQTLARETCPRGWCRRARADRFDDPLRHHPPS